MIYLAVDPAITGGTAAVQIMRRFDTRATQTISLYDRFDEEMRRLSKEMKQLAEEAIAARERFAILRKRHATSLRERCGMEPLPEVRGGTTIVRLARSSPPKKFSTYQGEF